MAESQGDYVSIYPDSTGKKIKTFISYDSSQNAIETQAMVVTDSAGNELSPLTEATGQKILAILKSIDKKLGIQTGTLPST